MNADQTAQAGIEEQRARVEKLKERLCKGQGSGSRGACFRSPIIS